MTEAKIEVDGKLIRGMYGEENGVAIVYYNNDVKFADCRHTPSNIAAKWLLPDLARKRASELARGQYAAFRSRAAGKFEIRARIKQQFSQNQAKAPRLRQTVRNRPA